MRSVKRTGLPFVFFFNLQRNSLGRLRTARRRKSLEPECTETEKQRNERQWQCMDSDRIARDELRPERISKGKAGRREDTRSKGEARRRKAGKSDGLAQNCNGKAGNGTRRKAMEELGSEPRGKEKQRKRRDKIRGELLRKGDDWR